MNRLKFFFLNNTHNFYNAMEAVLANKIRSMLTALGIIFGVAAVIAMLAIGTGAQDEILKQIKLVGVNNIEIKSKIPKDNKEDNSSLKVKTSKFSPGLTLLDAESIKNIIPGIEAISPEIVLEQTASKNNMSSNIKLVGVLPSYFQLYNFEISEGKMFNEWQIVHGEQVCIIGKTIKTKFFSKEEPIGKMIKCGSVWLKVVGVMEERKISQSAISNLGIRDYNTDVYVPLKTILLRYKNRALVTAAMLNSGSKTVGGGGFMMSFSEGEEEGGDQAKNYHQLDRLVIQVKNSEQLTAITALISKILQRRHLAVVDYEIKIPELLLKQQQRTKDIFNIVLGAIAGISLVVGGIGIMNIMLASVMERIKEIGLRLSIGATKNDIVVQFLCESVFISLSGGIIGVLLGIFLAVLISKVTDITTIVTFSSIVLSFGVAASVGLVFGIMPARKAALQDPITSLRHE